MMKEIKINGKTLVICVEGKGAFGVYDKHTKEKVAEFLKNSLDEYPIMRLMNRPKLMFNAVYYPVEDEMGLEYHLIGMKSKIYSPRIMDEMQQIENVFFGVNSVLNMIFLKEKAISLIKSL